MSSVCYFFEEKLGSGEWWIRLWFGAKRMSAGAVASGAVVERVGGRNGASAYRERSDGCPGALDSAPRALVTFREKSRVSCHVTPDLAPDF